MRNPSSSSAAPAPTNKTPCCGKVGLKRGPWTPEEDELLANYIKKEGEGRWRTLPKRAGLLRCGKSCRLRWMNYLRPSLKRGQIAPDEEDLILRLHRLLGNRWSLIAGRIPGRTDNEIKNYWNTHLSKKLISQGIDPRTHKPLNTADSSSYGAKASSSNAILQIPKSNPTPSVREETANNENEQIQRTNFDQYQTGLTEENGYANMPNSDGSGLRDNYYHGISNEEDADGFNYGTDDVFSSFLNSFINEDVFATQHQLQPQPTGNIAPPVSDVALIPSPHNFGFGTNWESALISSTFSQNDLNNLNENVESALISSTFSQNDLNNLKENVE